MSNQVKFQQIWDRVHGGIPNQAARKDRRIADDLDITQLPDNIVYKKVARYDADGSKNPRDTSLGSFLSWIDAGLNNLMTGINKANEGIAGLTAAVKALSEKQGVDPVALEKLINTAVEKAADKHLADIGTYELRKVEEGTK